MKRICKLCGKEFEPSHFNQKICKDKHYHPCPVCGKPVETTNWYSLQCCSPECTAKKRAATNVEKFGCTSPAQNIEVQEKTKQTNRERYGVDYPALREDIQKRQTATYLEHYGKGVPGSQYEILSKRREETCLSKYGAKTNMQTAEFREKCEQVMLEKYGVTNPMYLDEVKKRMKQTVQNKYGASNIMKTSYGKNSLRRAVVGKYGTLGLAEVPQIREKMMSTNMGRYGVPWYCMTEECRTAAGGIVSKLNLRFSELLESRHLAHEMEFRVDCYSFDFKVGDTLVEINPTFTHNCIFNPFDKTKPGKGKAYHIDKSKAAWRAGYRCIHVWDWDDWNQILSLLQPTQRISARCCQVKLVGIQDTLKFLRTNHIQGGCKGIQVSIGLFYYGILVQIACFGKPRYNSKYQWELLRLCSLNGYHVAGGASKLMKYFVTHVHPESVISYCDVSKFAGKVYTNMGFQLSYSTAPNKHWCHNQKHITDNLLRQRGYDQLFGTNYGKGTSNEQLMIENGWLPVYDCGQHVFEWRSSNGNY